MEKLSSYELIILKGLVEDKLQRADNEIGRIYYLLKIRETLMNIVNNHEKNINITYQE